jgi:hypothetical protein
MSGTLRSGPTCRMRLPHEQPHRVQRWRGRGSRTTGVLGQLRTRHRGSTSTLPTTRSSSLPSFHAAPDTVANHSHRTPLLGVEDSAAAGGSRHTVSPALRVRSGGFVVACVNLSAPPIQVGHHRGQVVACRTSPPPRTRASPWSGVLCMFLPL